MGRERSSYPLVTLESGDFSVPRIRDESQNFPVAQCREARGYVKPKIALKCDK